MSRKKRGCLIDVLLLPLYFIEFIFKALGEILDDLS